MPPAISPTTHRGKGMRGVRIREGTFEGQCAYCREYLPLTMEFWPNRNHGLRRCKACLCEYKALKQLGYVAARRAAYNAAVRARKAFDPPEVKAERRRQAAAWKAANRERVAEYNREYRARKRAA